MLCSQTCDKVISLIFHGHNWVQGRSVCSMYVENWLFHQDGFFSQVPAPVVGRLYSVQYKSFFGVPDKIRRDTCDKARPLSQV